MIQYLPFTPTPNDTVAMGDGEVVWTAARNFTIVYVSAAPTADDSSGNKREEGIISADTDIIAGITCDTAATPGRWLSTHVGGDNAPVQVAADSVMNLDFNSLAVGVGATVVIGILEGTVND